MALTDIEKVRVEIQDFETGFYMLSDEEIQYLLDKASNSTRLASIDAARVLLLKLSQLGDETVSIFSIRGSKTAEQYRESLKLYINNASLNPNFSVAGAYAAGISTSDKLLYNTAADTTIQTFEF